MKVARSDFARKQSKHLGDGDDTESVTRFMTMALERLETLMNSMSQQKPQP
jgi:hypothetical protein